MRPAQVLTGQVREEIAHAEARVTFPRSFRFEFALVFLLVSATLAALLGEGWLPGHIPFSNDGPLGRLLSDCHRLPDAFTGVWQDLNSVGYHEGSALPNITFALRYLLGPLLFARFYAPVALLILAMGAWCFFRQSGFTSLACLLGALAATLNSTFFSAACWGVASHAITVGMNFFALAALVDTSSPRRWTKAALAGAAVGMGVSEGADIGAIFSVCVAGFVVYQAVMEPTVRVKSLARGATRLGLVILFAILLASQALVVLVSTQIQHVSGAQPDETSKAERWDWATRWSLPKREALGIIIPGLFGYRMDTPHGGAYWGSAGRDPAWTRYFENGQQGERPTGILRFTGGGNYAGVLVAMVACWAILQSFRGNQSVFTPPRRRWIWFWAAIAFTSLLLAFGRFAPFYSLLYALPYSSSMRNPAKFVHIVNWALVILFGYGAHALCKRYLEQDLPGVQSTRSQLKAWWSSAKGFDYSWTRGCCAIWVACFVAFLIYAVNRGRLSQYLRSTQFSIEKSDAIARFSTAQTGWFLILFAAALGLLFLILSSTLNGRRAGWGGVALVLFLLLDLVRADRPWVVYWNYQEKYATNPIIETLRQTPLQHRVVLLPFRATPRDGFLEEVYRREWAQHQFPLYNIQSLDVVQMSRVPEDLAAFENALQFDWNSNSIPRLPLRWQLTNTRYLLGAAALLDVLNNEIDTTQHRFQIVQRFNLVPRSGSVELAHLENITAVPSPDGQYALFEFKGALPRARLYSNWLVQPDNNAVLDALSRCSFNAEETVLLAGADLPETPADVTNNGTVDFSFYSPKQVRINTRSGSPGILVLNDHFDPNWHVQVDGFPTTLLRANFLMQGVFLPGGHHVVEFRFAPDSRPLYLSLGAVALGLGLLVTLLLQVRLNKPPPPALKSAA